MPQPFPTNPLGLPFIEIQSVDSTNNYALERVHAGLARHGMAFFAHEQLAGKGRMGKTWSTEKDSNIILSVIVQPGTLALSQQFGLSACTAVSVYEFFRNYGGSATRIKWPNDLYWQDRKAGGILIESVVSSQQSVLRQAQDNTLREAQDNNWQWAVLGMGININQTNFPVETKNPVSLKQVTGKEYDPPQMAKELCAILDTNFKQLLHDGSASFLKKYNDHLYKKDERVKLKKDSRVFEALIKGVSSTGHLITKHSIEEEFAVGEVEWLL